MEDLEKYEVLVVKRKDGATRVVFPQSVEERIPWIRESVTRILRLPVYDWPDNLRLVPEQEFRKGYGGRIVVLPDWLLERAARAKSKRHSLFHRATRSLLQLLTGFRAADEMACDFAYVFSHYVSFWENSASAADEECSRSVWEHELFTGSFLGGTYGPRLLVVARWAHFLLPMCALAPVALLCFWLRLKLRIKHVPLLYALADMEKAIGRRERLRAIREELLAAGEPPENLTEYVLSPDLEVIEDTSCSETSEHEQSE